MTNGWTVRVFPIQGGKSVLWTDAEIAYKHYAERFGTDQSLERLAQRGWFGDAEFAYLFRGLKMSYWDEWPVDKCKECNASGEVVDSTEGGLVFKCGVCIGCGVVPKA